MQELWGQLPCAVVGVVGVNHSHPFTLLIQVWSDLINVLFPSSVNWTSSLLRGAKLGQRAAPCRLDAKPVVPSHKP